MEYFPIIWLQDFVFFREITPCFMKYTVGNTGSMYWHYTSSGTEIHETLMMFAECSCRRGLRGWVLSITLTPSPRLQIYFLVMMPKFRDGVQGKRTPRLNSDQHNYWVPLGKFTSLRRISISGNNIFSSYFVRQLWVSKDKLHETVFIKYKTQNKYRDYCCGGEIQLPCHEG